MLDSFMIEGENFKKVMSFVGANSMREHWDVPLDFLGNTCRLWQPYGGPCGLFAVLQANILLVKRSQPELSNMDLLIEAVLTIMIKLRGNAFTFCQLYDENKQQLLILGTNDINTAREYLQLSGWLQTRIAAKLLMISLIYLVGPARMASFALKEVMVDETQNTHLQFVLLMLTGMPIDSVSDRYCCKGGVLMAGVTDRQNIGLLLMNEGEAREKVGYTLSSPIEKIWIIYTGSHFLVIEYYKEKFRSYDNILDNDSESLELKQVHPLYSALEAIIKMD